MLYAGSRKLLEESKILIVDDSRLERSMIRQIFTNYGFQHVFEAENGKEAWEKTLELSPDLVVLDINMPVMDGFSYIKKTRQHKVYKNLTILVQTGVADKQEKTKIFEAGATDFIEKNIDANEMFARSFIHLEKAHYIKELEKYNKRVKKDLDTAKRLIEMYLPSDDAVSEILKHYHVEVAAEFRSCNEMGGDFWGFDRIDESSFSLYCIDVSGHGIDSAFNALRLHTILHASTHRPSNPGEVLTWIDKKLSMLLPRGHFSTMFYGVIDIKQNILSYATSATPSPIIIYHDATEPQTISGKGFPLGINSQEAFETYQVPFNAGDTLVLYSDALIEAVTKSGDVFGEGRLLDVVQDFSKNDDFSSEQALDSVLKEFYEQCGEALADDLTVNIYHRKA